VERAREVHVAEDEVRLRRLVGAAEQDGVGALADELHSLEIADDRVHRQREHTLAVEDTRGRGGRRLQLVVVELEAGRAQVAGELGARARGRVRHETEPVPVAPQRAHRLRRAGDRLT
jgi:hypothetical protein